MMLILVIRQSIFKRAKRNGSSPNYSAVYRTEGSPLSRKFTAEDQYFSIET